MNSPRAHSPRYGRAGGIARATKRSNSATIIVGAANEWMQRFHDRMPIILDWRDAGAWMAGAGR